MGVHLAEESTGPGYGADVLNCDSAKRKWST